MANPDHIKMLKQGVEAWNAWRTEEPSIRPDLSERNLEGEYLFEANLSGADLRETNLFEAFLSGANLTGADLRKIDLCRAHLEGANLTGADLREADLHGANLSGADFTRAYLNEADLRFTNLVKADFTKADLTGCRIYGISAWKLKFSEDTKQRDLIITEWDEPKITVDNIEVAQFIYLLLNNEKIRDVIDTIGKKAVLILGRFTPERKAVLDAIRGELRERGYLPLLFDFDKPASKDLTGTVLTLAHMARFIIADLTDPSSVPYEVSKVADAFVPIQPILLSGKSEFAMFADMQRRHHWVLPTHRYAAPEQLIANLDERVIRPAEAKVLELRGP
jgi:uncharacterized protein YjbI with pentapeptide repeats